MPKRKKHPRLPNSFGSVRYLGANRTNCYAVHPPCKEFSYEGNYIRPKALCYVNDWYVGFAVLTAYHAGTYKPGDELEFSKYKSDTPDQGNLQLLCDRILRDYSLNAYSKTVRIKTEKTFAQVYDQYYDWKYGEKATKKLSYQSKDSTRAAYKNCSALHNKIFRDLRLEDLQAVLDKCTLKQASIENMKSLLGQMYKFAIPRDLCEKNYAQYLVMPNAEGDEHGVPFTDDDLALLWKNKSDPIVEMILIMCYSGYRITAYKTIEVNLDDLYFRGGVKTASGKNRIVPIHSAIKDIVADRVDRFGSALPISPAVFRKRMRDTLKGLKIAEHTPHDCRHTFSCLCERYKVNEADRKRMMGHSFGSDITNGIYGPRTVDELRVEIEKIKIPKL